MNRDIEFLEDICQLMLDVGAVRSKSQFSTQMLGKGASYLTSMRARNRRIQVDAFNYLSEALKKANTEHLQAIKIAKSQLDVLERRQATRDDVLRRILAHASTRNIDLNARDVSNGLLARFRWLWRKRNPKVLKYSTGLSR